MECESSVGIIYVDSLSQHFGTAFYIGNSGEKHYIATCNHVRCLMDTYKNQNRQAIFMFQNTSESQCIIQDIDVLKIATLDYAILEIKRPSGELPSLGRRVGQVPHNNEKLFFIGHPNRNPPEKKVSIGCRLAVAEQEVERVCQVLHSRIEEQYKQDIDLGNVSYQTVDFFEGSSGSPGFNDNGQVVLMHRRGILYSP